MCFVAEIDNTCKSPIVPANGKIIYEDWRVEKRGVLIRCDLGYGLEGNPDRLEGSLVCVQSSPSVAPIWNPDPSTWTCASISFIYKYNSLR